MSDAVAQLTCGALMNLEHKTEMMKKRVGAGLER